MMTYTYSLCECYCAILAYRIIFEQVCRHVEQCLGVVCAEEKVKWPVFTTKPNLFFSQIGFSGHLSAVINMQGQDNSSFLLVADKDGCIKLNKKVCSW